MNASNAISPRPIEWNTVTFGGPAANSNVPVGDENEPIETRIGTPNTAQPTSTPELEDSATLLHRLRYGQ